MYLYIETWPRYILPRLTKWLPRFLQPKFFVYTYITRPPDIWPMAIYNPQRDEDGVLVKEVTFWEAKAIIALLPNDGKRAE